MSKNEDKKSEKKEGSLKDKFSYKSVSEVDESNEFGDDEHSKKDNFTITSHRTVESQYIKEFLEGEENMNDGIYVKAKRNKFNLVNFDSK